MAKAYRCLNLTQSITQPVITTQMIHLNLNLTHTKMTTARSITSLI